MGTLAVGADERVVGMEINDDTLSVSLMDGRTISVPLAWYPRLLGATKAQRENWKIAGGGYGLHWPDIDEGSSTKGPLRGAPADVKRARITGGETRKASAIGAGIGTDLMLLAWARSL